MQNFSEMPLYIRKKVENGERNLDGKPLQAFAQFLTMD